MDEGGFSVGRRGVSVGRFVPGVEVKQVEWGIYEPPFRPLGRGEKGKPVRETGRDGGLGDVV